MLPVQGNVVKTEYISKRDVFYGNKHVHNGIYQVASHSSSFKISIMLKLTMNHLEQFYYIAALERFVQKNEKLNSIIQFDKDKKFKENYF